MTASQGPAVQSRALLSQWKQILFPECVSEIHDGQTVLLFSAVNCAVKIFSCDPPCNQEEQISALGNALKSDRNAQLCSSQSSPTKGKILNPGEKRVQLWKISCLLLSCLVWGFMPQKALEFLTFSPSCAKSLFLRFLLLELEMCTGKGAHTRRLHSASEMFACIKANKYLSFPPLAVMLHSTTAFSWK